MVLRSAAVQLFRIQSCKSQFSRDYNSSVLYVEIPGTEKELVL